MPVVQTRIIDGLEITIQQLPPMRWLAMAAKLGKTIAPSFIELQGITEDSDIKELGKALKEFFDKLNVDDLLMYTRELLHSGAVKLNGNLCQLNNDDAINLAFDGKPGALIQSFKFALDVNDFFAATLGAVGYQVPKNDPTSTPTQTSPSVGQSGGST